MEQSAILELITKDAAEARVDLFRYNIEAGVQKTINLIQKLTLPAKETGKEKELNRITAALMAAVQKKDYLLFSDIACYELPALFDMPQINKGEEA